MKKKILKKKNIYFTLVKSIAPLLFMKKHLVFNYVHLGIHQNRKRATLEFCDFHSLTIIAVSVRNLCHSLQSTLVRTLWISNWVK